MNGQQFSVVWNSSGVYHKYTNGLVSCGPYRSILEFENSQHKSTQNPILTRVYDTCSGSSTLCSHLQLENLRELKGRQVVWKKSGVLPLFFKQFKGLRNFKAPPISADLTHHFSTHFSNHITENISGGRGMARHTGGWVKFWRKAALGDINSNFTRGGLFGALIAMANIQESTVDWLGKPRRLKRGQIATSLHELAELGGIDVKTVSRHLSYLSLRDTITVEKSTTGTIITFNNYEEYAGVDAEGSTRAPHGMDDDVHTIGIHNEELKNKRKKEVYAQSFEWLEKIYSDYPRKIGKSRGFSRLKNLSEADRELLKKAVANYAASVVSKDQEYIKHFSTFASEWRDWVDYISPSEQDGAAAALAALEEYKASRGVS